MRLLHSEQGREIRMTGFAQRVRLTAACYITLKIVVG